MKKIYFLLFALILASCGSNKEINSEIEEIRFGNGGGFTGKTSFFILKKDGDLLNDKHELIKSLSPKETSVLFTQANALTDYSYHEPENLYSFLEISSKEGENRIVWGLESESLKDEVKKLHKELLILTR